MSERLHGVPTPEGEYFDSGRFAGLSFVLGVVAVIALVLCAVGAIVNPHQFGVRLATIRISAYCMRRCRLGRPKLRLRQRLLLKTSASARRDFGVIRFPTGPSPYQRHHGQRTCHCA